jgi:hypothetical protein
LVEGAIERSVSCASFWAVLAAVTISSFPSTAEDKMQPQLKYEAAIRNDSTSPSLILLTVIDDRTGKKQTGCTRANFLVGAIQREMGASVNGARDIALANLSHTFHFTKQDAIDSIPIIPVQNDWCDAVRRGQSVRIQDRTGRFMIETEPQTIFTGPTK